MQDLSEEGALFLGHFSEAFRCIDFFSVSSEVRKGKAHSLTRLWELIVYQTLPWG